MTSEIGEESGLRVVVFSGGRGSEVISRELLNAGVLHLTVGVNGYDDGASTGEVRRVLGDALGPSDYRKNASRLARVLRTCEPTMADFLEGRLPQDDASSSAILESLLDPTATTHTGQGESELPRRWLDLPEPRRRVISSAVRSFRDATEGFDQRDCAVGNVVFGGFFVEAGRDFNRALTAYTRLLGLPDDVIVNVTDGTDAHLVAIDTLGRLVPSEEAIVDGNRSGGIREIFLIDHALSAEEVEGLKGAEVGTLESFLARHEVTPPANELFLERLRRADLIVSAPGTQHSSLYPSYMVPGVAEAIASNLSALKLLITNIHQDAEITDQSAVGLVELALYYMRRKGRSNLPAPSLITHYLMNDPEREERGEPYVPLGSLESIEDPRLVRVGNFQDARSGRHNAAAVLDPFLTTLAQRGRRPKVAVVMLETHSVNQLSQTLVEMVRGGAARHIDHAVICEVDGVFDPGFLSSLPMQVMSLRPGGLGDFDASVYDYVVLVDSSGMYRGEDVVNVLAMLSGGTADAVWGSRRLSLSDIRESYRVRYRHNRLLGAVSYLGSHMLSLAYLVLFGRYISDTLVGIRAVRSRYLAQIRVGLESPMLNHELLTTVLADRGGVFETPVLFFPLSPDRVHRTTVKDGVQSIMTIARGRFRSPPADERVSASSGRAGT